MNYQQIATFSDRATNATHQPCSIKNTPPCSAIDFSANDINGKHIQLSRYKGKGVLLCFFRDTARPSRNQRIFELTRHYREWKKIGIQVIVVFNEKETTLKTFFGSKPRPFPVIADPKLTLYKLYGVKRLIGRDITAPKLNAPRWLNTLFRGKLAWLNPAGRIMPADFLINPDGIITTVWHGTNEHDHIPLERLETFAIATRIAIRKKMTTS